MQSQDERDMEGLAARRERERDGVVRELGGEEITGRYEGEELETRRATRPPDERFNRLENKHDELKRDVDKKHDDLKADVRRTHDELKKDNRDIRADMKGLNNQMGNVRTEVRGAVTKIDGQERQLAGQEKLQHEILAIVKESAKRDHVSFTARVDVDKAQELAKVEVTKAEGLAKVELTREEGLDKVQAKKDRRAAIAGGLVGGGSLVELLHQLGVL